LQQAVEFNKTLLVDGPASVCLVSGRAELFGYQLKQAARVVVRGRKRLPFFVLEKAVFDISLGANASVEEAEGNTNPESWNRPLESILRVQKKPVVVLVLGKSDSGKSSYCTYLLNKLVDGKCRVAVLDGDLGQSDIGPSGTVSYAIASKPLIDLYNLRLKNAFFVGVTSPNLAVDRTIEGLAAMEAEILQKPVNFVLVNTDGWVTGEDAVSYKTKIITELKPDVIVAVQVEDELTPLTLNLNASSLIMVEPSSALCPRSPEKRRNIREMTYIKFMKDAKLHCYPISQMTVEPRRAIPKNQEPEKGLLVGLYGSESKFLGIGVLREVNRERKALKVQTAVSAKPSRLVFGKGFLNMKLQEIQG